MSSKFVVELNYSKKENADFFFFLVFIRREKNNCQTWYKPVDVCLSMSADTFARNCAAQRPARPSADCRSACVPQYYTSVQIWPMGLNKWPGQETNTAIHAARLEAGASNDYVLGSSLGAFPERN